MSSLSNSSGEGAYQDVFMEDSVDDLFLSSLLRLEPFSPIGMQTPPNQTTESSGIYPILEEYTWETLPPPGPPISGAGQIPPASNPFPTPDVVSQAQNFQLSSNAEDVASTSMPQLTSARKRKAPTLRADAWNPYKYRIIELHIEQDLPLTQVKEVMEKEFGFKAEYAFSWLFTLKFPSCSDT